MQEQRFLQESVKESFWQFQTHNLSKLLLNVNRKQSYLAKKKWLATIFNVILPAITLFKKFNLKRFTLFLKNFSVAKTEDGLILK